MRGRHTRSQRDTQCRLNDTSHRYTQKVAMTPSASLLTLFTIQEAAPSQEKVQLTTTKTLQAKFLHHRPNLVQVYITHTSSASPKVTTSSGQAWMPKV